MAIVKTKQKADPQFRVLTCPHVCVRAFASALAIGGALAMRWRLRWPFCRRRCAGSALAIFWFVHIGAGNFSGDVLATVGYYVGDVCGDFWAICWRCATCAGDGPSPLSSFLGIGNFYFS